MNEETSKSLHYIYCYSRGHELALNVIQCTCNGCSEWYHEECETLHGSQKTCLVLQKLQYSIKFLEIEQS